jgi:hypothetical protein
MKDRAVVKLLMRCALLAPLFAGAASCDKNPIVDDGNPPPREPVTLPVMAQGVVTTRYSAEVAADGRWVYTTSWSFRNAPGNTIFIWDAQNGLVLVDSVTVPTASTLGDVQISDDGSLLVVATERNNGSIVIFDRTRPDSLVLLSRYNSPDTDRGVHTVKLGRVDGRLYAFLSIDPSGSAAPAQLVILDISDPAQPVPVFVRVMGLPYVHDVFVRDGYLFTALWNDGVSIWDIGGAGRGGSPASPVLISNIKTANGSVHNLWWYHDAAGSKRYLFVGEEAGPFSLGIVSTGDIHVVDISNIEQPREVAFYNVPGAGTHNFTMDETNGILYAAYYNAGVRALDVRGDLSVCDAAARAADGRCNMGLAKREAGFALSSGSPPVSVWGVARVGSLLYASDMLNGVFKIDIASLQ